MQSPSFNLQNHINLEPIAQGDERFPPQAPDETKVRRGQVADLLKARRRRAAARMKKAKLAKSSRRRNRAA